MRSFTAPVKEPFKWPNNSDLSRFSGIAPQLTATKGPRPRPLLAWIASAHTSLPVPLSPVMNTVARLGATQSIWR
jgi:hypothetical protein